MDHDFYIELISADGLESLRPFIGEMPFMLQLVHEGAARELTLMQDAVSEIAGFYAVRPHYGDRWLFAASVRSSPIGDPEDVMGMVSAVFSRAKLPHWIWRIEHDLDEDELVVDQGGDNYPSSHRGKERWSERTEDCV